MLKLARHEAADFNLNPVDVSRHETNFAVAGERQQCALTKKRERFPIRLDDECGHIRLAGNIAAGALDTILDYGVDVSPNRSLELESVRGVAAFLGRHISQRKGFAPGDEFVSDLALVRPSIWIQVFLRLIGMPFRQHTGGYFPGHAFLCHWRRTLQQ